jgi:hypothetical protein
MRREKKELGGEWIFVQTKDSTNSVFNLKGLFSTLSSGVGARCTCITGKVVEERRWQLLKPIF